MKVNLQFIIGRLVIAALFRALCVQNVNNNFLSDTAHEDSTEVGAGGGRINVYKKQWPFMKNRI